MEKSEELSEQDKNYIEKGGVIIRPKGYLEIECFTESIPHWHIHAGCKLFEDMQTRDAFFKQLLEFADYKEFKL
jgi:hypothetical protein